MNPFGWLRENQSSQNVNLRKLEKLIRADRSTYKQATADAILALGDRPFSEEIFSFLKQTSSTGPYADTALLALGMMGHPKTIELLVADIRRPGVFYERSVKALSNPRNQLAVGPMLEITLTSTNFLSVESALRVLAGIGTPQAQEAIKRFREAPSRIVTVLWTGFETEEPVSTTFLGQVPSDSEFKSVHDALIRENTFSFGSQEEALAALSCLSVCTLDATDHHIVSSTSGSRFAQLMRQVSRISCE